MPDSGRDEGLFGVEYGPRLQHIIATRISAPTPLSLEAEFKRQWTSIIPRDYPLNMRGKRGSEWM